MNNLVSSFLPIIIVLVVWFVPVALIYKAAESARKNTDFVLVAGIILGWLGAGIVALVLPRMGDDEWSAFKAKRARVRDAGSSSVATMDLTTMVLCGLGVMALICGGFIAFLAAL